MPVSDTPPPTGERPREAHAGLRAALLREKQREETKIALARESIRRIERELATLDRGERRARR